MNLLRMVGRLIDQRFICQGMAIRARFCYKDFTSAYKGGKSYDRLLMRRGTLQSKT